MRSAEPTVGRVSADVTADVAADVAETSADAGTDTAAALRARGLRMTQQRARVEEAVRRLGHATPEQIAEHLAADSPPLPLSTVYRALDALERVLHDTGWDEGDPGDRFGRIALEFGLRYRRMETEWERWALARLVDDAATGIDT